jgi:hypothetical protein
MPCPADALGCLRNIFIEVQALQFGSKDVGATDAFFPCPGPRPRGIFFNIPPSSQRKSKLNQRIKTALYYPTGTA